jgi:hypothetical protein
VGYVSNSTDCDDNNINVNPGATEVCNGIDDDCDGFVDEGAIGPIWYQDLDTDGYGNATATQQACSAPVGYVSNSTDCDDNNINVNPGATEVCNGIDDDCDTLIDEGVTTTYYRDFDSDGYGNATATTLACSQPSGYVLDNTDCNDSDANEYPGQTWYKDADNDLYSDGTNTTACARPTGYNVTSELTAITGDCDDSDPLVNPGATEVCNDIDDDCDSLIDEGVTTTYYRDFDSDGYGNATATTLACSLPTGYVLDNTDCNDSDVLINPGATEVPYNGKDDDCNATTPDDDLDGDTYGIATDCNDTDASVNPGAIEIPFNGKDDDCNPATADAARIQGQTREVNCSILPGVNVTAYLGGVPKASAISDGSGNYTLQVSQAGTYTVVASKAGFRPETQTISVTGPTTYTSNFWGDHGLIPNAPSLAYAQQCIYLWRFGAPPCNLSQAKAMAVVNAWRYPI